LYDGILTQERRRAQRVPVEKPSNKRTKDIGEKS
jgi:hypothetical protein